MPQRFRTAARRAERVVSNAAEQAEIGASSLKRG
jgi:hypothetical protein